MNILILHGIGGHAGIHWQGWLRDELTSRGHSVLMPELSDTEHPDRQVWLRTVEQAVRDLALGDLIIVGHSLGVTTALDLLERVSAPVKALVSVSGFAVDYGAEFNGYFLREKAIDFDKVRASIGQSLVLYGDNDPYVTQDALAGLADGLGVKPVIIAGGGHLNTEAGYTEFPQLLDLVLAL